MKKETYIKIVSSLVLLFALTGVTYATITIAKDRKSPNLPWQGNQNGYYDSAHNVGDTYLPQARFSFDTGSAAGGTSVVKDSVTGLYWQSNGTASSTLNWDNANIYCSDLVLGGYDDWRLPTIKELASIVDLSKTAAPYIGTNFFTSTSRYWSSTTYADNTSSAWFVYFLSGYSGNDTKTINYFVRCVR